MRERLLEPREHREQPAHVARAHGGAAVVHCRDDARRLALDDHVRLHEPLLVEQPGEPVEDAEVVGRHRPRRVDALPVVQHTVGVVDRRQPPQPLAHAQPAVGQELGHTVRAVGRRGRAVHVAAPDVAVEPVHTLEHVLVLLRHDRRLERREAGRLRLDELAERAVDERHRQRRHQPLQHGVRLADGDRVAHRQEASAARAPQRLALARLAVDRAALERPLHSSCRSWCGRRRRRRKRLVGRCRQLPHHQIAQVAVGRGGVRYPLKESCRVAAGELEQTIVASGVMEAGDIVHEAADDDPARLGRRMLSKLSRLDHAELGGLTTELPGVPSRQAHAAAW